MYSKITCSPSLYLTKIKQLFMEVNFLMKSKGGYFTFLSLRIYLMTTKRFQSYLLSLVHTSLFILNRKTFYLKYERHVECNLTTSEQLQTRRGHFSRKIYFRRQNYRKGNDNSSVSQILNQRKSRDYQVDANMSSTPDTQS